MSKIARFTAVMVFVVILSVGFTSFASGLVKVGKPIPQLVLRTINGKTVRLHDLRGKVVLLDVWATWCPPCREEIPHLQQLHKKYGKRGLTVIGVSFAEGKAAPAAFAKQQKLTYTIAYTDEKSARVVAKELEISPIPTTYIVDRKGIIRSADVGFEEQLAARFEDVVKKLLAEK